MYMQFAFGKKGNTNSVAMAFKRLCLPAWHYLNWLKRDDHTLVAKSFQRLESSVMIKGAVSQFMEFGNATNNHLPVLTIHDSMIIPPTSKGRANFVIKQNFNKIGCQVSLKEE